MPKSTALKSSVTRRPASDLVDQPERQLQAEHHQAAENAATTAQEAPTAAPEPAPVPKAKHDSHALQVQFLSAHLNKPVVIFLVNGLRLTGRIKQYDQFTVLLEGEDSVCSMIFKHAIASIAPVAAVTRPSGGDSMTTITHQKRIGC